MTLIIIVIAISAEQQQGGGGVAALGLAERGHAVGDRLDAGQRRAAGGEGAGQQEHQRDVVSAPS